MSGTKQNYVHVATIGAPYGVQGFVKLRAHTEPVNNVLEFKRLYIQKGSSFEPFVYEDERHFKNDKITIRIPDITSPEAASAYVGLKLFVLREDLPQPTQGQYYWHDLEGLQVVDTHGVTLGIVSYLFNSGANDVMVLVGPAQAMVPFIPHVVQSVDLDAQTIVVDWELAC